ncbi:LOW QUALITY PROTEIN: putative serine protease K12H4.7 [Macrobrachium rosenbergii]|uniref:LOW QUALITY PROTEIN: putative serine protease K12H4.7 n=1 Tax=Macrobrachium rosenbergii TaxID=79674 RepID=UPI0034D4365A
MKLCLAAVTVLLLGIITPRASSLKPRFRNGRSRNGFLPPPPVPEGIIPPGDQWFTQHVDHFNPTDTRTWSQKYYTNFEFYVEGGPVFLMIGGEGPASLGWMYSGSWYDNAKQLNAALFQVEHRYYGDSHPTEDMSSDNLAYLSSEQALADLATFTVAMQEELGLQNNKWIVFGGSYSGSLAAWYRLKYPHLAHGAVATSAPMIAKVDFREYMEVVRNSLATASEDCNVAIKEANAEMEKQLADPVGWGALSERFRLCSPLDASIPDDVSLFFETLADNFAYVVQYNNEVGSVNIDSVCAVMQDESLGDPLDRYQEVNTVLLDLFGESCLEHRYDMMVEAMQKTKWEENLDGGRAWVYQTCTEFGWYQSSDSDEQPFAHQFPLDFFIEMCQDIYGTNFTREVLYEGVARTNAIYGGLRPEVTRVVFPNGSIDPWHAVSILSDLSSEARAIYINGTAHCADMYSPSPGDPPELDKAREEIFNLVQTWLSN